MSVCLCSEQRSAPKRGQGLSPLECSEGEAITHTLAAASAVIDLSR
jgi:hypothetical protein